MGLRSGVYGAVASIFFTILYGYGFSTNLHKITVNMLHVLVYNNINNVIQVSILYIFCSQSPADMRRTKWGVLYEQCLIAHWFAACCCCMSP